MGLFHDVLPIPLFNVFMQHREVILRTNTRDRHQRKAHVFVGLRGICVGGFLQKRKDSKCKESTWVSAPLRWQFAYFRLRSGICVRSQHIPARRLSSRDASNAASKVHGPGAPVKGLTVLSAEDGRIASATAAIGRCGSAAATVGNGRNDFSRASVAIPYIRLNIINA